MSTFKVTVERLASVEDHPNADRLDVCKLESLNYQFVTGKHNYKPGDQVIYFPIDSVIPLDLAKEMSIEHLVSKDNDVGGVRIRTVRLRGLISQGVVAPPDSLEATKGQEWDDGDDLTDLLGVKKFEKPEVAIPGAKLVTRPSEIRSYSLENAERFPRVVEKLMDQKVCISEKLEGSHFSATLLNENRRIAICCGEREIIKEEGADNPWHKAAHDSGIIKALQDIPEGDLNEVVRSRWVSISLRGELVGPGIQGNYYGLPSHKVYVFEIEIDSIPIGPNNFLAATSNLSSIYGLPIVPLLGVDVTLKEWLDGRTLSEASNGKSELCDRNREGIVIRPMDEQSDPELGRLIVKQRSPEYLAKSKL